jgi:hypothetical protein
MPQKKKKEPPKRGEIKLSNLEKKLLLTEKDIHIDDHGTMIIGNREKQPIHRDSY